MSKTFEVLNTPAHDTPVSAQNPTRNIDSPTLPNLFNQFIDLLPHPIIYLKDHIGYSNTAFSHFSGIKNRLHTAPIWQHLIHPDDLLQFECAYQRAENFTLSLRFKTPNGQYHPCHIQGCYQANTSYEWLFSLIDLALYQSHEQLLILEKIKELEQRLQYILEVDELTGLHNRNAYNIHFKKIIDHAEKQQKNVGLLLINLDYFKHVNDTFGHIAGDHLLQVLGDRFKRCFSDKIFIARLGGDEFSIIIPDLTDEAELLKTAHLANAQINAHIPYANQNLNGGMSIGCSIYPRDAQNTSNLLKCADIALNDLKNSGRGGIRVFNSAMSYALEETTKQLALARYIIQHDRIVPFYQPKVRLSDGKVIGFEALLRWRNEKDQLMAPAFIMAAFQDYELATRISEAMQIKIFTDMQRWVENGLEILPISINAAPVEFLRDDYAETFLNRLTQFDIPFDQLELEITEQSLAEHGSDYVIRALYKLKENHIQISLDDFGTGHSSLTRLREYPVDCIKIDRNFVEHLHHDPSAVAIVKAITQIGSSISLDILVEGIENLEQLDTLKACDCNMGQGFFFYRPMPGQEAEALLKHYDHPII
jgi:diguanylate cyclase (GGDEF)-like protein